MPFTNKKKDQSKYGFAKYSLPEPQPINYVKSRNNSLTSNSNSFSASSTGAFPKVDAFNNDNSINRYNNQRNNNITYTVAHQKNQNSSRLSSIRANSIRSYNLAHSNANNQRFNSLRTAPTPRNNSFGNTTYNSLSNFNKPAAKYPRKGSLTSNTSRSISNQRTISPTSNGNIINPIYNSKNRNNSILSNSTRTNSILKPPSLTSASQFNKNSYPTPTSTRSNSQDETIISVKTIQVSDDYGRIKSITTETVKRVNGLNVVETKMEKVLDEEEENQTESPFGGSSEFVDAVEDVKVRFDDNVENIENSDPILDNGNHYEGFDEIIRSGSDEDEVIPQYVDDEEMGEEFYQSEYPNYAHNNRQFNFNSTAVNTKLNSLSSRSKPRSSDYTIPESINEEVDEEALMKEKQKEMYDIAFKIAHERVFNTKFDSNEADALAEGVVINEIPNTVFVGMLSGDSFMSITCSNFARFDISEGSNY